MIAFLLIVITVAAMEERILKTWEGSQRRLAALETNEALNRAVQDWATYGRDAVSAHNNYGPIEDWDVSLITSMIQTFKDSTDFNENLSAWDVSSVTAMDYMFKNANSFNGDISGWDISSVTSMGVMFYKANSFNGDISGWDVSSVTSMQNMFMKANSFNGDISGWDVSSVNK